jgi:phosphoglycerate dehydrogenase-like enzyme
MERLFSDNDIIVELAPLIPETVGTVTEAHLRLIRPGGVFINVGRGAVVDEAALLRVAAEGKIQVGLDVFTQEPLPKESGFRGLRNVTLTPHLAGPTTDRRRDAGGLAVGQPARLRPERAAPGRGHAARLRPVVVDNHTAMATTPAKSRMGPPVVGGGR